MFLSLLGDEDATNSFAFFSTVVQMPQTTLNFDQFCATDWYCQTSKRKGCADPVAFSHW